MRPVEVENVVPVGRVVGLMLYVTVAPPTDDEDATLAISLYLCPSVHVHDTNSLVPS
jgi:hypothetical protein